MDHYDQPDHGAEAFYAAAAGQIKSIGRGRFPIPSPGRFIDPGSKLTGVNPPPPPKTTNVVIPPHGNNPVSQATNAVTDAVAAAANDAAQQAQSLPAPRGGRNKYE